MQLQWNKTNFETPTKFTNLWPPLSSTKFSFHVFPKATLNSIPLKTFPVLWTANIALAPGRSIEKIESKSLFT